MGGGADGRFEPLHRRHDVTRVGRAPLSR
jgi:hypothetical protein